MKATANSGIDKEDGSGYEPDAGGGGVDAYDGYRGGSAGSSERSSERSPAREPSIIDRISKIAEEGVPFAGGNIKPAKIGRGYGAKWTMNFAKGGKVSSASKRADGIAQRGKTKGRYL